eukprot:g2946.t1
MSKSKPNELSLFNNFSGMLQSFAKSTQRNVNTMKLSAQIALERPYREQLSEFYRLHNPTKVKFVDRILQEHRGKERDLFRSLFSKYPVQSLIFEDEGVDYRLALRELVFKYEPECAEEIDFDSILLEHVGNEALLLRNLKLLYEGKKINEQKEVAIQKSNPPSQSILSAMSDFFAPPSEKNFKKPVKPPPVPLNRQRNISEKKVEKSKTFSIREIKSKPKVAGEKFLNDFHRALIRIRWQNSEIFHKSRSCDEAAKKARERVSSRQKGWESLKKQVASRSVERIRDDLNIMRQKIQKMSLTASKLEDQLTKLQHAKWKREVSKEKERKN